MMPEDDQVEIKVNVAGNVSRVLKKLRLDDGTRREIFFYEDLTPGLDSRCPLLDAGLVLRLRRDRKGVDSTVKLRPCRRTQLMSPWDVNAGVDDDWDFRIEADWSGSGQVLAASLQCELPRMASDEALTRPASAFRQRQREFLSACASIRVNTASLSALGPIRAARWRNIEIGSVGEVNGERWEVNGLDLLELSIRVGADQASAAQRAFEQAIRDAGIEPDHSSESKTARVLDALTTP